MESSKKTVKFYHTANNETFKIMVFLKWSGEWAFKNISLKYYSVIQKKKKKKKKGRKKSGTSTFDVFAASRQL